MEQGTPFPPAKAILPTVVALHNKIKAGVDLYSRMLKNVPVPHAKLPPETGIWVRLLKTILYNIFQSHKCWKGAKLLASENTDAYTTY
jgi:hypothetical protein